MHAVPQRAYTGAGPNTVLLANPYLSATPLFVLPAFSDQLDAAISDARGNGFIQRRRHRVHLLRVNAREDIDLQDDQQFALLLVLDGIQRSHR